MGLHICVTYIYSKTQIYIYIYISENQALFFSAAISCSSVRRCPFPQGANPLKLDAEGHVDLAPVRDAEPCCPVLVTDSYSSLHKIPSEERIS